MAASIYARAVSRLLGALQARDLRVALWTGEVVGALDDPTAKTVHIRDRGALIRAVVDPGFEFGELYTAGRIDLEGDLISLLRSVLGTKRDGGLRHLLPRRLIERALRNDAGSAVDNAQHHYDVSNEFYRLWLDERMVYTCGYFPTREASLEDAQLAKMDHVCAKVRLQPGERVVEAGSGWGSLALHMAQYYGVTVRAFNVSLEQVAWAREQAEKKGLQDRVEFVQADYREIEGEYDAFVSVGMLEHVGLAHYAELGGLIDRCLAPAGRGLLHTIGRAQPQRLNRWVEERLFPNAHPPTLGEMMGIFEPHDLSVLDVENLRLHYGLTAEHWLRRFESHLGRIEELVGIERMRRWRLYLAGTAASFQVGNLHLYQAVFSRSSNNEIPWTRAHQYVGGQASESTEPAPDADR